MKVKEKVDLKVKKDLKRGILHLLKREIQAIFNFGLKTLGTNLFIANFNFNTRDEELRELFEKFGTVTSCKI